LVVFSAENAHYVTFAPRSPAKSQATLRTVLKLAKRCRHDLRERHSQPSIVLPKVSNGTTIFPSHTPSHRYLLLILFSITYTLSTRGARAGQPQSACAVLCRSFSAFHAFRYAHSVLETPEHGDRPTVALSARAHEDHEEVPAARLARRIAMVDGTLRSFAQALIDSGFFTNVIVGWMEIVVGSVRADTAF
jgi:hypothetical protein